MAAPIDLMPPVLGRYRLDAVLGRGAMGTVYRALDPAIGRPVAVKVMRTDHIDTEQRAEFLARFAQEVRAAAGCPHPAIVTVHDVGGVLEDTTSLPFIVMELVEGGTLAQRLADPAARAAMSPQAVLLPVLDALATVHRAGIVHRDVKPGNILHAANGQPKLTDFGIARLGQARDRSGLTQTGTMIGTLTYMAPEQARGETADHRADLFSVACILHEMLTGSTPFGRDGIGPTMMALLGPEPAPIEAVARPYRGLLARALAKRAEDRFASAADFAATLSAVSAGTAPDLTMLAAHPPSSRNPAPFDCQFLSDVSAALVTHLGPITQTLVRREAARAESREDLLQGLATHLDPTLRGAFLRDATHGKAAQRESGTAFPHGDAWPHPDALDAARSLLRHEVGPIADLVVRRAVTAAANGAQLADALARELRLDAATSQRLRDVLLAPPRR